MITLQVVRKVSEAIGAKCRDCDAVFEAGNCQYWHWSKSKWMHENGSGHKLDMYRIAR